MESFCLITGASGGIGMEFARIFAKNGYNLVLVARNREKLETLKEELETRYAVEVITYPADLTSSAEIERLYEYLTCENISVNILVNNAGFGDLSAFFDSEWERQQALIDLNITALVRLTYLIGNNMRKHGSGKIINLSSVAAFSAGPNMSLYYASKSFVLSFSEALSEELKGSGVTVTALCPGPTATGFEKNANMGRSVMFSRFKPATAAQVAQVGYRAAMHGKSVKYHGFVTYAFNLVSRLLPRSMARSLAAGMNQKQSTESF